jgi:hypothetical protein
MNGIETSIIVNPVDSVIAEIINPEILELLENNDE